MTFNPKWILEKTVARVELRPFPSGRNDETVATDPRITFTDGSRIEFRVQETETDYGVAILYVPAIRRLRRAQEKGR